MSLPINKRDFDVFLSHAHKDALLVSAIDQWLTNISGFSVWYDARELSGGSLLATDLQRAMERCRGILLLASDEALKRGWVEAEYNSAMDERANNSAFRVVAIRLASASMDRLMKGTTWITMPAPQLDKDTALSILRAFYPGDNLPTPATSRDVFISCSWHSDDNASARAVCSALAGQGFRLIGDAKDQSGFGSGNRVQRIIESCGAFVSIVPFRGDVPASLHERTYKYFLAEQDFAATQNIPSLVIADPRVRREDGGGKDWIAMDTAATECPPVVQSAIEALWEQWQKPARPQYIFCAMDLTSDAAHPGGPIRHLIERITGMPTIVGSDIHEAQLGSAIMESIRNAFLVIADLTDDNVNACIEAGMALTAGANVELLAAGPPRRPPFMLRSQQMLCYGNEVERYGVIHKIARRYRRRVLNPEL